MDFKTSLTQLIGFPSLHARFVNTLSLLEYIGARKILKSQQTDSITAEVLAHMSEELRHAQVLKKVALKLSGGELTTYSDHHLLCPQEAKTYIQTVDFAAVESLGSQNSWLNYLYTTLLLEERANELYPWYDTVLSKLGFPGILKAIVKEEDAHMRDVLRNLSKENSVTASKLAKLRLIEQEAFALFMEAVNHSVSELTQRHNNHTAHIAQSGESYQSSI
jgi:hypothetical protein